MAIQKIFKSTIPSIRYYCKNGFPVVFVGGKFTTDNKKVEEELLAEVGDEGRHKSSHPFIFIDENESEVDTEALSPAEQLKLKLKAEAREEILTEIREAQARAMDVSANVSSSSSNHAASVATTASMADAASESNEPAATNLTAKLAMLKANAPKS